VVDVPSIKSARIGGFETNPRPLVFYSGNPEPARRAYEPPRHDDEKAGKDRKPNIRSLQIAIIGLRPILSLALGIGVTVLGNFIYSVGYQSFNDDEGRGAIIRGAGIALAMLGPVVFLSGFLGFI